MRKIDILNKDYGKVGLQVPIYLGENYIYWFEEHPTDVGFLAQCDYPTWKLQYDYMKSGIEVEGYEYIPQNEATGINVVDVISVDKNGNGITYNDLYETAELLELQGGSLRQVAKGDLPTDIAEWGNTYITGGTLSAVDDYMRFTVFGGTAPNFIGGLNNANIKNKHYFELQIKVTTSTATSITIAYRDVTNNVTNPIQTVTTFNEWVTVNDIEDILTTGSDNAGVQLVLNSPAIGDTVDVRQVKVISISNTPYEGKSAEYMLALNLPYYEGELDVVNPSITTVGDSGSEGTLSITNATFKSVGQAYDRAYQENGIWYKGENVKLITAVAVGATINDTLITDINLSSSFVATDEVTGDTQEGVYGDVLTLTNTATVKYQTATETPIEIDVDGCIFAYEGVTWSQEQDLPAQFTLTKYDDIFTERIGSFDTDYDISYFLVTPSADQLAAWKTIYNQILYIVVVPEVFLITTPVGLGSRYDILSIYGKVYNSELNFENIKFDVNFGINYNAYEGYNLLLNFLKNNEAVIEYDWGNGIRFTDVRLKTAPKTEKQSNSLITSNFTFERLTPWYIINTDLSITNDFEGITIKPVITFTPTASICFVKLLLGTTEIQSIEFNSVPITQNIVIDCENKTVKFADGTSAYGYIDKTGNTFIEVPDDGLEYTITFSNATNSTTTYKEWVID